MEWAGVILQPQHTLRITWADFDLRKIMMLMGWPRHQLSRRLEVLWGLNVSPSAQSFYVGHEKPQSKAMYIYWKIKEYRHYYSSREWSEGPWSYLGACPVSCKCGCHRDGSPLHALEEPANAHVIGPSWKHKGVIILQAFNTHWGF